MELDLEYDQKFEEMKKYIPFLENMIKRLESSNSGSSNPRKAQLDKIRSLRDLLLDKKKRMKMENLLKCEQVLINLYAKVEQRDSMADSKKIEKEPEQKDKSDLNVVRNKLKSVVLQLHDPETLPEIARATHTEIHCTGSKEPALFQRRPNKASPPCESSTKNDELSLSKRHYTRVLTSPEPKKKEWPTSATIHTDKPLFSRRSPRRSPRRYSPSYKKERKKSSKQRSKSRQETKDLNITLKVPQESLNSLNTDDILSRIINCSDNDVDIDTLRGLRSQILGELKQTGAKDDISDLILKSYKKKQNQSQKNTEIEEGEISDSESEAIENIYGSLVVVNKDKESLSSSKTLTDNEQPRKIQICLVINSEKEETKVTEQKPNTNVDITEFESYSDKKAVDKCSTVLHKTEEITKEEKLKPEPKDTEISTGKEESVNREEKIKTESPKKASEVKHKTADKNKDENKNVSEKNVEASKEKSKSQSTQDGFKPNFYQPLTEDKSKPKESQSQNNDSTSKKVEQKDSVTKILEIAKKVTATKSATKEVKKDIVSEIDILQALKKEILGESVAAPKSSDAITPPLHQPKVTKVSSAKEISSKKRISIENYKQKSVQPKKQTFFNTENNSGTTKDDNSKKQSLKLTEKECERFNLPAALLSDDSSDDENSSILSMDDIYNNIKNPPPKSPDHDDFADTGIKPPVIIPSDPIKSMALCAKADIDMRTLPGPTIAYSSPKKNIASPLKSNEIVVDPSSSNRSSESIKKTVPEPLLRTESNKAVTKESPSPYSNNSDRQSMPTVNYPSMTPTLSPTIASPLISMNLPGLTPSLASNIGPSGTSIMTPILTTGMPLTLNPNLVPNLNPNMTPNRTSIMPVINPIMTPLMTPNARSYEMTPLPNFDSDEFTQKNHVYAPLFNSFEQRDFAENDNSMQNMKTSRWEGSENSWDDRDPRNTPRRDMDYHRNKNDRFSRDSFNVRDSPQMRMDCPPTPNPSFGRMETPMTPVPSFGRSDGPRTPSHPFGRSEANISTPTNVFSRGDYRHNMPNQSYKRSQDPRLNRSSDYDNYQGRNEERNRYYNEGNPYQYRRGQGVRFDKSDRQRRDHMSRRESTLGQSPRDFDTDETYKKEYYNNDNRYRSDKPRGYDEFDKRRNQRSRSIGRVTPSEEAFSPPVEKRVARTFQRDKSVEKLISVKSHSGPTFNIDTSLHRTFQEKSSQNMSFDARRQRASSVGRVLREPLQEDFQKSTIKEKWTCGIPNRNINFRRACSVGRELKDSNESKNFTDIKADLRSCKFDNYEKKIRDQNNGSKMPDKLTDVQRTKEARNSPDHRKKSRNSDTKVNKFGDNTKYSPRFNYRDPRVRREINAAKSRNDKLNERDSNQGASAFNNRGIVYSNDNIAKGTILASAAGVRNFKIPKIKRPETKETEIAPIPVTIKDNVQSKNECLSNDVGTTRIKNVENKEVKSSNTSKEDISAKSENKSATIGLRRIKKVENKELTSESSLGSKNNENTKEKLNEKMVKVKSRDSSALSKKKDKDQSQDDDTDSVSSMSDNSDRRLTRSTRRSTLQLKQLNKESPVKKLRRIKKPLTNDSDSDSDGGLVTNEDTKKDIDEDITSKANETKQNTSGMKNDESESLRPHLDDKNKTVNNKLEMKPVSNINSEVSIEQDGLSLDSISFAGDDDYFNDNDQLDNPPGFVLDNINDLIADLDHHIEAPKLNDFNDKFISNIVGSISSTDSPTPIEVNENDFAPDLMVSDKHISNEKENNNKDMILDKKEGSPTTKTTSNTESFDIQSHSANLIEITHNVNNDAIVSTTANDGKAEQVTKELELSSSNTNINCDSFVPDSTMSSNEMNTHKDLCSDPDSTIDVTSEMNSDITSTHSSADTLSKDQSVASSSSGDALPRLESISKFLSILEDKNKIKELLSFLGKDSSENEKIKKKLEKLSEIVSDDEEEEAKVNVSRARSSTDDKNTTVESKDQIETGNKGGNESQATDEKKFEIKNSTVEFEDKIVVSDKSNDESHKTNDDKKPEVPDKECLNEINEEQSKSASPVQDNAEQQSPVEKSSINDAEEISKNQKDVEEKDKNVRDDDSLEKRNEEETAIDNVQNSENINSGNSSNENIAKEIEKTTDPMDETEENMAMQPPSPLSVKKGVKKSKITKRGRSKLAKKMALNKEKRVTRSEAVVAQKPAPRTRNKTSRELLALHEDIREMKIGNDILNATGIRMCRLAKLVDDKNPKPNEKDVPANEAEPVVLLEKIQGKDVPEDAVSPTEKQNSKKPGKLKSKLNREPSVESKEKPKYKPGPKSKTKKNEPDPYSFENDSIAESNNTNNSRDQNSDSESDSIDSVKSFDSSELLVELKKKGKRKRRRWQLGVLRTKSGRKKKSNKEEEVTKPDTTSLPPETSTQIEQKSETNTDVQKTTSKIPDPTCFTDKSYCFYRNAVNYSCRLCEYKGPEIVLHYKKNHPHSEIPLSRLRPSTAREAIEQCENMNLQQVSKIHTSKYVCRFCFAEFQKSSALETFFWHVVSVHTGEYKHLCSECINVTRCPFHLDIPPPPKSINGQLIGYICGRCNFTQVSLENLKTHVIVRHDDEQTEVYSINLSEMPKNVLMSLLAGEEQIERPRVLRSTRSNQSLTEPSDDLSDITGSTDRISTSTPTIQEREGLLKEPVAKPGPKRKIQPKFVFENDDMSDTSSYSKNDEIIKTGIKLERDEDSQDSKHDDATEPEAPTEEAAEKSEEMAAPTDVFDHPHFKVKYSDTGSKEYVCCINREHHYQTSLLISFKKHVQMKHAENWDGYCYVCKVIVMSQGVHKFKDCLQHFLDKHMDNFPVYVDIPPSVTNDNLEAATPPPIIETVVKDAPTTKPYINVRPLSDLITAPEANQEIESSLPKIQSVVSLGAVEPVVSKKTEKVQKLEDAQQEVMLKKNRVVLETMLSPEKLIQVFKCAGRFCSYTTDNAEEALVHASTHKRLGGESSLTCAYCNFDPMGNAIDLVMHVFKTYSHCSYSCSKCFYRAASSQLVYAHVKRIHKDLNPNQVAVLSTQTGSEDTLQQDDILSRDEAVMYYNCGNRDPETGGRCQFKSFVLTKFREHLQMKHTNDNSFSCNICNIPSPSLKEFIRHLKAHGLRIYQCCRCLFGGDNENELIAHASEMHPLRQPKAYLRIITSKGPNSEVRVLPLAVLSKTSVETTIITPATVKENPVQQAERSIDLENLIRQTTMVESMATTNAVATTSQIDSLNDTQIELESHVTEPDTTPEKPAEENQTNEQNVTETVQVTIKKEPEPVPEPEPVVEPEPVAVPEPVPEPQPEPVSVPEPVPEPQPEPVAVPELVSEPLPVPVDSENINQKAASPDSDVVCLDSDEDSSQVIDLSGDDGYDSYLCKVLKDTRVPELKVSRAYLFRCSRCSTLNKTEAMFKKHLLSCFVKVGDQIKCAHCPYEATFSAFIKHTISHLQPSERFPCSFCDSVFVSKITLGKHVKRMHGDPTVRPSIKASEPVTVDSERRERPKRKLSSEAKTQEPPPKLKKYGPQDVDRLPINPILDDLVYCAICEFSTKVRLNMVRHLQLHAEQQPVPRTAPVNPVPHLGSNEMHFDRMVNLASSSIALRNDKTKDGPVVTEHLSPEAAAGYPKYVPARHRYTCGAKDCAYISVNESMFKFHWETLHQGTNDYHCVHCPPHQHLDTTKPLTAIRIIAHLKMHDTKLYACSSCTFYHHTRKIVEKHLKEIHAGKVVIVREDGTALPPTVLPSPPPVAAAPTMDLKPWQCGLCKFKSMLRPEVMEHCRIVHQSKMQFKCSYCGFRASNIEYISQHQRKQHPEKKEEVFYFYYREGSIPDEVDSTPRWQKQSQKNDPDIKTEVDPPQIAPPPPKPPSPTPKTTPVVNLDIVKKEVVEPETLIDENCEDLCKSFGQFCDPNGLKYKCPLCKTVTEDTKEAMQSHLYEELQYRKWGCAICSYKAFHKPGLELHVQKEHAFKRTGTKEPIELQVDARIETWVAKLLEHQTTGIEKNKENLAKQKAEIFRPAPGSTRVVEKTPEPPKSVEASKANVSMAELEKLFGPFGVPSNLNFCCPKCATCCRTESVMQEHLESELNKIRWLCSICNDTFQTYHEAQFHCRSVHQGQSARPVEATRDITIRSAWVASVIRLQKLSMNYVPVSEPTPPEPQPQTEPENSLLVVRYEKNVPTPEEQMKLARKSDDNLVTPEATPSKVQETPARPISPESFACPHCPANLGAKRLLEYHILKHFNLKPYQCPYCPYTNNSSPMVWHIKTKHPNMPVKIEPTAVPLGKPNLVCLTCEKIMTEAAQKDHRHDNIKPDFGTKGAVVYKCCICLTLYPTISYLKTHHNQSHHQLPLNYSFYKLHNENRVLACDKCRERFNVLADFRTHCQTRHKETFGSDPNAVIQIDDDETGKRKAVDHTILPPKKVAKKSTTKLPNVLSVARKSTTKLPFHDDDDLEEYSFYGTKPSMDNLQNVTTVVPVLNQMVTFTIEKLDEIFKMNPRVLVEDINKKSV